jgi:DNA-binding CsgD family transcriptional regulator
MRGGYGQFGDYDSERRQRRMVPAHRYAWELEHGPIPVGWKVVHTCGKRACVRISHLTLLDPSARRNEPTPGQLAIVRRLFETGTGYGRLQAVATELGLTHQNAATQMRDLRKRIGAPATKAAVELLMGKRPAVSPISSSGKCVSRAPKRATRATYRRVGPIALRSSPVLTPRQFQILQEVAALKRTYGASKLVAMKLGIAQQTVKNELYHARQRLGVGTTDEAILQLAVR